MNSFPLGSKRAGEGVPPIIRWSAFGGKERGKRMQSFDHSDEKKKRIGKDTELSVEEVIQIEIKIIEEERRKRKKELNEKVGKKYDLEL